MTYDQIGLLKQHWERATISFSLSEAVIHVLVARFISKPIANISLRKNGCANLNYKIDFVDGEAVLLRIYVRDASALKLEQALLEKIYYQVPVARILYAESATENFPYAYAIMEFKQGTLMRDVLLAGGLKEIEQCAYAAGEQLAILRSITLPQAGFFKDDLSIRPFNESEEYLAMVYALLNDSHVKTSLGKELGSALSHLIISNLDDIPENTPANLTHADYDASNLLVVKKEDKWQVNAILDWEFAYAGTYLLDMGLFLRYASFLPRSYEEKFVQGLVANSASLPTNWKRSAKLMDILCLLQLLASSTKEKRPITYADIIRLLQKIIKEMPTY